MQQTRLWSTVHRLVVVLVMASAFGLFACPGGTGERRNINATAPLNSTSVTALEGSFPTQFTIPAGSVFNPGIGNNPVTLTFILSSGSPPTGFILAKFGSSAIASGGVTFGSCTLTATASSFPAGQGPQTGDAITFSTCDLVISANNVEVGGDPETGTVTLMLTNAATGVSAASVSQTLFSSVAIQSDGILLLNNVNMGVNTNVTGTVPK